MIVTSVRGWGPRGRKETPSNAAGLAVHCGTVPEVTRTSLGNGYVGTEINLRPEHIPSTEGS